VRARNSGVVMGGLQSPVTSMQACRIVDLRCIAYGEAAELQERLVAARKAGVIPDLFLVCEHPHVITLGRNGKRANLHVPEDLLSREGVEFHHSNRGGDITYHGPGQIVGYPILDLNGIRRDVVWYVRQLEECMIRATSHFGINAFRVPGCTGVWVHGNSGSRFTTEAGSCAGVETHKLASIGVHISRWVTSHGFAYNVSADLRFFDWITPCGIAGCRMASLESLLGDSVSRAEALGHLSAGFSEVFGLELLPATRDDLDGWLRQHELAPVLAS
jgi:lipoyl(octanoyl) transferase